jgi:hypothetical protein
VLLACKITGGCIDRGSPVGGVRCGGRHCYTALLK